jgi:hypothetical protein
LYSESARQIVLKGDVDAVEYEWIYWFISMSSGQWGLESRVASPIGGLGLSGICSTSVHYGLQKTLASDCKSVLREGFRIFSGTLVEQIFNMLVNLFLRLRNRRPQMLPKIHNHAFFVNQDIERDSPP